MTEKNDEKSSGRFRKKKTNFSMVSNTIIRDETISLKAKGLYTLIQSYITLDSFTLYKSFLMKKCIEGERAFDSAWKELKEKGYLKQYKMREGARSFYYEYELLDEPETEGKSAAVGIHDIGVQNIGVHDIGVHDITGTEDVCINNIIQNNTEENNTDQIISIKEVMDQIGFDTFGPQDSDQVKEITMLITDVLNTSDDNKIWIGKKNLPAREVKSRFAKLDLFHIQYVLMCLKNNCIEISNVKNYLLTVLYNAPTTMNTYYQNRINL